MHHAPPRIGVLGGTFDPIHYGHLANAEEARCAFDLTTVYLIPAVQQPLKAQPHLAQPEQRLAMVRLACGSNPALHPSDIELHRPPPSYTVDTLRILRRQHPDATLFFILGADTLPTLPRWHAPADLIALAELLVLTRPGAGGDLATALAALEPALPGLGARTHLHSGPSLDIASSTLRARLAAGQPVRYQLPDEVLAYIHAHGLYGSSAA